MWKRLTVDGKPHPDTFMRGSNECRRRAVERAQDGAFKVVSGLDGHAWY